MRKTVVLNVVGLTPNLLGPATPRLSAWAEGGRLATVRVPTPAVTCTVQSTYLTGAYPDKHGIVGNGWYFRSECEVKFWRQANPLVQAPKIWEKARQIDPAFTCANLFWWFNMYSAADVSVTPRPMYPADGRKLPDVYSDPPELRFELQKQFGTFPLFNFWGPRADLSCSRWIADAAKAVEVQRSPTLTLVYLPHLDYGLQKFGPNAPEIQKELQGIDAVTGDLIDFYEGRGAQVIVLSEYGITDVSRPVHLNRILRENGLIAMREERGRELLDAGASAAFAVADHQVAHVYVNDPSKRDFVRKLLENTDGVERVLDDAGKREARLNHPRAGEFVAVARRDAWFTYYYWLDDRCAPDYARTVDIHRKPGYDPVELFTDPKIKLLPAKVAWTLLKKRIGMRYLMDVIPLDATLVKGSHGRVTDAPEEGPLFLTRRADLLPESALDSADVSSLILRHLRGE